MQKEIAARIRDWGGGGHQTEMEWHYRINMWLADTLRSDNSG